MRLIDTLWHSAYTLTVRELILMNKGSYVDIFAVGGLLNPAPGVLDFNDWRDLQSLFDAAKAAGIFIVLRPGKTHRHLLYTLFANDHPQVPT